MKLWKPILVAALAAGVLDLIYAFIHIGGYYKMEPMAVLQSIARGVLGPATTTGGWGSAVLGLFLEFALTGIMAAAYIVPAKWITDLRKYWWIMGPAYGIVVMVVMYTVVLPLSGVQGNARLPDGPLDLSTCRMNAEGLVIPSSCRVTDHQMLYGTILVHMFIVGLVISAAARFLWPKETVAERA